MLKQIFKIEGFVEEGTERPEVKLSMEGATLDPLMLAALIAMAHVEVSNVFMEFMGRSIDRYSQEDYQPPAQTKRKKPGKTSPSSQ